RLRFAQESPSGSEEETPAIWLHSYRRVSTMFRTNRPSSSARATMRAKRRMASERATPSPIIQTESTAGRHPFPSMIVKANEAAMNAAVTSGARISPTVRSIRGRKTTGSGSPRAGSDTAGGDVRHEDRAGSHRVQAVHARVLGLGGDHRADRDPLGVPHGGDGGALQAGRHGDGFGEAVDGHVVVDEHVAAGDHDALEATDDHLC